NHPDVGRAKRTSVFSLKMSELLQFTLAARVKWFAVTLVFLTFLNVLRGASLTDILKDSVISAAGQYTVSPANAEFFIGVPVTLKVALLNTELRHAGWEIWSDETKEFTETTVFKIPELQQATRYRPVFYHQWQKKFGETYLLKPRFPDILESMELVIRPPAYLNIKETTTRETFVSVFPGTHITVKLYTKAVVQKDGVTLPTKNRTAFDSFTFTGGVLRTRYKILSVHNGETFLTDSPPIEITAQEDRAPDIRWLTQDETSKVILLPKPGTLVANFLAVDDFGFQNAELAVIQAGKLINSFKISPSNLKKYPGEVQWSGQVKIPFNSSARGEFFVFIAARDNSRGTGSLPWHSKQEIGQTVVSAPLTIRIGDSDNNDGLRDEIFSKALDELPQLLDEWKQSELELKSIEDDILQGRGEIQKLREWESRRDIMREKIEDWQKKLTAESDQLSSAEKVIADKLQETLSSPIDKKIAEKEKKLSELLQKFPGKFNETSGQIRQMSRESYLQNLENSIRQIEKLTKMAQLRKLKDQIQAAIDRHKAWQKDALANQFPERQNIEKFNRELQSLGERGEQSGTPFTEASESSNAISQMKQASEEKEAAEMIAASAKSENSLRRWKEQVEEKLEEMGQGEAEKVARIFRETSFKINRIATVWHERTEYLFDKSPGSESDRQKAVAKVLADLRSSYKSEIQSMFTEVKSTGMLSPELSASLSEVLTSWQTMQSSLEASQYHTARNLADSVRWKMNRASLALLKDMQNMQNMMMAMRAGNNSMQNQNNAGEMQSIQSDLNSMSQGKGEGLSLAEKEYLSQLSERQKQLEKKMAESAANGSNENGGRAKEQLKENGKPDSQKIAEIQNRSDLKKTSEKYSDESKKFLQKVQGENQGKNKSGKKPMQEREAQAAREYRVIPPPQLPESENEPEPVYSGLDSVEAAFFENYLRNLQKLNSQLPGRQ
ncbi:MAG: hypothetical protein KDK38_09600, partial [Leptospiraceae bacterium]|nr:hypothetical protein [Leptospiraceae bacterium]